MSGATFWALVLSSGLIGWAAVMRIGAGTWLQPAAFFPMWWCFAGVLPLILAPREPVAANAIIWLIAASVAVSVGAIVGNRGLRTRRLSLAAPATDRELWSFGLVTVAAIILGIGSSIAFVSGSGIGIADVFQLERLVLVSNQLYFAQYADGGAPSPPVLSRALLPFVYLAPAAGGILFVLGKELRWKMIGVLAFLPAAIVTVLQTTKAAVLFAMILWFSGYFATRLRLGRTAVFTRRHMLVAAVGALVMVMFFLFIGLARLASTDVALAGIVVLKLITSAFGHMTVFSQWLAEYWSQPLEPSLGAVTFAGPLELLGYSQRMPGLFEGLIELVAGETSNIFTGFRPLIQDFSVPGALAILAVLGFVGGSGFRLVAAGRWSAVPLLIAAYVTILWTPITWFWIYNSLTATVLAVALVVWSIRLWRGSLQATSQ